MVKCDACGREMTTASGCKCSLIKIDGEWMRRIKCGGARDLHPPSKGERCYDCGAKAGHYHHPGCDSERCPKCGLQLISCSCDVPGELAWEE